MLETSTKILMKYPCFLVKEVGDALIFHISFAIIALAYSSE